MNRALPLALAGTLLVSAAPLRAQQCGVPVGTVVAYMGNTVPDGWLIADGRPLQRSDFRALYEAIGTVHGAGYQGANRVADFNLPDLRGQFLRGVDRSDTGAPSGRDQAADRRAAAPGGNTGMAVGTVEAAATQMPQNKFAAAPNGRHSHEYTHTPILENQGHGEHYWHLARHLERLRTSEDGEHGHTITGGDRETRPTNVAVYWIICTRGGDASAP